MEYWVSVEMCNEAALNWPVENCIICIIFNWDNWVLWLTEYRDVLLDMKFKTQDRYWRPISYPLLSFFIYTFGYTFAVAVLVSVLSKF